MQLRQFACVLLASTMAVAGAGPAWNARGVHADEPAKASGDAQLAEYFRSETAALRDGCLAEIKTLDDWNAKRGEYRRQLFEMLGLDPLPERTDLKATITGRIERDDFVVEKLHFQSRPGLYVTANLYLPKAIDKPCPTILYLCGHGKVAKDGVSYGNKVHYQHHGIWFARHGYVCLVLDTLQLGEIEGIHHGTYRESRWWWNARGYTPAGVEAWNSIRALDYLTTRKEVDAERIGATGRSGGGAYTWFIAALDDRIKVAVPVAGITDLQNHVVDGCVEGHCDCMYFVNTYRWDYPQLAALVAPRPLLISNTDKDNIFPLDGVLRTHRIVRRIYALHGAEKNLGLQITEGPHADTQELYTHAFVWFDRFLGGGRRPIDGPALPLFEPEELKVFDKLPADEINTKIDETFVAKAAEPKVPESKEEWDRMRDGWMKDLREKVFRGWPDDNSVPMVNAGDNEQIGQVSIRRFDFFRRDGARLNFSVWAYGDAKAGDVARLIVNGTDESPTQFFGPDDLTNRAYRILSTPRADANQSTVGAKRQVQDRRRFMLLGQTLAGMQVWDVQRTIQAVRSMDEFKKSPLVLEARGDMAVIALYASLFEPGIAELRLYDLPTTLADGPDLLNVLRSHDLPAAVAMAAGRCPVKIITAKDAGNWNYPRRVIESQGWDKGDDGKQRQPRLVIEAPARSD
ncbi:MAG: acetylxylan esterase [Pirellulales bacterium]